MRVAVRLVIAALILVALSVGPLPGRPASVVHAASVPAGLPSHFGIGLAAQPPDVGSTGWLPTSGIPWDYAYTYLSGGVNTSKGSGWQDWNTGGQYPLYYAQSASTHGYIPVFPYYELHQSTGSCDSCGEAQKDLSNLNNPSLMQGYFANFRLLMQRLGAGTWGGIAGFGKTAIVQVEPDLSGYAEQAVLSPSQNCYSYCSATGNNPSYLAASVASSGDPDVQGYPNTYQGFNWALLHLRDLYAPNVLLAFHVSDWATMQDVGSSTDPNLDVTSLGQEAGSFAAQSGTSSVPSGVHPYDLVFNDVSDRDAGYYKYVYKDSTAFWDRWNVTLPNFHRWESYIGAVSSAAGRSVMVWQIPEGNQYFQTENNTNGHYQDNRAEYFFGHIPELVQAGIIGLLFGAGNAGSTVNTDAMKDGITNPSSFCTSDGSSQGQVCNNHPSTVSDDDGGYLRMAGQQYFGSGGYSLVTASQLRVSAPATVTAGSSFSLTVSATDGSGAVANGYRGTVRFTSADPQAVLPPNYTFTASDGGSHTFTVTLKTAGPQTITVTDTTIPSITGTSPITVNPGPVAQFRLTSPSTTTPGTPFVVRVTAGDAFGNTTPGYTGTVHYSSSDGQAILPANYTFTGADGGVRPFTVTLQTPGSQTITVTDTANASLTAHASILVTASVPVPYAASSGWNLVGGSPLTVWSDAQAAWSWSAITGQWTSLTSTSPAQPQGSGAWEELSASTTETVSAEVCTGSVSVVVLPYRWNLVGNPCNAVVQLPTGTHAVSWNGSSYALTTSIAPGAAAWVVPPSGSLSLTPA